MVGPGRNSAIDPVTWDRSVPPAEFGFVHADLRPITASRIGFRRRNRFGAETPDCQSGRVGFVRATSPVIGVARFVWSVGWKDWHHFFGTARQRPFSRSYRDRTHLQPGAADSLRIGLPTNVENRISPVRRQGLPAHSLFLLTSQGICKSATAPMGRLTAWLDVCGRQAERSGRSRCACRERADRRGRGGMDGDRTAPGEARGNERGGIAR